MAKQTITDTTWIVLRHQENKKLSCCKFQTIFLMTIQLQKWFTSNSLFFVCGCNSMLKGWNLDSLLDSQVILTTHVFKSLCLNFCLSLSYSRNMLIYPTRLYFVSNSIIGSLQSGKVLFQNFHYGFRYHWVTLYNILNICPQ